MFFLRNENEPEPIGAPKKMKNMTNKPTRLTQTLPRVDTISTDLTRIAGERGLLMLVLDAAQSQEFQSLPRLESVSPTLRPQMMLTLVAYAYASSLYGSRDIESAAGSDATIRYICAGSRPDQFAIRSFRRRNRDAIRQCLVYVLKQCWAWQFDRAEADYAGYEWFETQLNNQLNVAANERIDAAIMFDRGENE